MQQPPPETGFTVLVVPEKGAQVQRLTVAGPHVDALLRLAKYDGPQLRRFGWIAGSVAVALFATAVGMTWHYVQVVGRAQENTTLREENLELKAKLASIKERVAHIHDTLTRVKHLNANLQNITQLQDPERGLAVAPPDEDPRADVDAAKLEEGLGQLAAEAQAQEETLRALTGYFEDRQAVLASAPAIWPVRGWVTSDYGFRLDPYTAARKSHGGMDIATAMGTPIVAPADGTVVYSAFEEGYGNVLVLDHGNGIKTRYGHLQKSVVRTGERVTRGKLIAHVGNTGRSTGPHLHYEVRVNGVPENPRKFILETDDPRTAGNVLAGAPGTRRAMGGD